jgi:hypothetical protein
MLELPEDLISLENVVVFVFCEVVGAPFCYAAAQEILDGKYVSGIIGFVIGAPFAITGVGWAWFKPWLRKALTAVNQTISPNLLIAALLVLFIYVAGPSFLGRVKKALSSPVTSVGTPAPPEQSTPPLTTWGDLPASNRSGPIGPMLAIELVQQFERLPKPCLVKVTYTAENRNLGNTLDWLLDYGDPNGGRICNIPTTAPNINDPTTTREPGIVIHWDSKFTAVEQIAHVFDADGFRVRISHQMPASVFDTLIWIDIGPGSPWK